MSGNGDPKPGLAWPDPSSGPTPPPEFGDPRDELGTRRRIDLWDRIKVLLVLAGVFGFLFWYQLGRDEGAQVRDVFEQSLRIHGWVLALGAAEVVRQFHYLIAERWAGYHRFWVLGVFGGINRWWSKRDDWARYRLSRAVRWVLWVIVIDLVLAWALDLHPTTALLQAPLILGQILLEISRLFILFFVLIVQFVGAFWFLSRVGREVYMPEEVKTRFSDVWGQDHVLEKVRENLVFLDDPESIEAKGGHVPGGVLLWGPPGTGKTLIAEAVAGETGKPFVYADVGAMNGYFVGMGVLTIKGLFRKLRKLAIRHGGVVVFLDEADALGSRGGVVARRTIADAFWQQPCNGMSYLSDGAVASVYEAATPDADDRPPRVLDRLFLGAGGGGGGGGGLQALLTELSGLRKPRGFFNKHVRRALGMRPKPPPRYRLLVMMATNMPSALDPALLRPGRIDRQYKVAYPSKAGRIKTYEGYLTRVRHSLAPDQIEHLATITPYATGATIKDLVNEALIVSIRQGRRWITWEDMVKARLLKALGPAEDVEYIERERHATALHEACHALVAYRVRHHATIDVATIEKGQTYLGMVASIPLEEQFTNWRTEYEADLMVGMAGVVGERLFFDGDQSSGVSGDLFNATTLAIKMEGFWGMGSTLGSHMASKAKVAGIAGSAEDGVDRSVLETELGRRVEEILARAAERTRRLLEAQRRDVFALAHALEALKTLTGDDIAAVIEGRPGTLIDGTVYLADGFLEVAETYHRRVLEAHRSHGAVEVPLPSATDWTAEPVGAGRDSDHRQEPDLHH